MSETGIVRIDDENWDTAVIVRLTASSLFQEFIIEMPSGLCGAAAWQHKQKIIGSDFHKFHGAFTP